MIHFDAVTLDCVEPLERVGNGVETWRQRNDAVLTGAVGHGATSLFNQRRAGDLHGDTGQNRS